MTNKVTLLDLLEPDHINAEKIIKYRGMVEEYPEENINDVLDQVVKDIEQKMMRIRKQTQRHAHMGHTYVVSSEGKVEGLHMALEILDNYRRS